MEPRLGFLRADARDDGFNKGAAAFDHLVDKALAFCRQNNLLLPPRMRVLQHPDKPKRWPRHRTERLGDGRVADLEPRGEHNLDIFTIHRPPAFPLTADQPKDYYLFPGQLAKA